MISSRALKGFVFAFLLILAGGFLMIGGSILAPAIQIIGLSGLGFYLDGGLVLIILGVLIGIFSLAA